MKLKLIVNLHASSRKTQYGYTRQMAAQLYSSDPSRLHSKCSHSVFRPYRGHESQYKLHLYGVTSYHAIVTCLISR